MNNQSQIKSDILKVIESHDLTFIEVQKALLEKGHSVLGDYSIEHEELNIYFWEGSSLLFAEAISYLLNENKIILNICNPLIYEIDGSEINKKKILTDIPKKRMAFRCWVPTLITKSD